MKTEDFIALKKEGDEGIFHVTEADNFDHCNLCECRNQFGRTVGCYYAGCYAIENTYSTAEKDCMEALCSRFGIDIKSEPIEEIELTDEPPYGVQEAIEGIPQSQIVSFIDKWKRENESHVEVIAWTYWDGNNHKTIVLDSESGDRDMERVNEELEKRILSELPETPRMEGATEIVETASFNFGFSRYQGNPWYCTVEEK